jgi:hypothetical protein
MLEIVVMSIILKNPDPDAASIYSIIKENENKNENCILI